MCEPDPSIRIYCNGGDGATGSRAYSGEIVGAFAIAELLSPDAGRRSRGDEHVGTNLGKLGGPGAIAGMWNTELENEVVDKKAKNFGFWFGFGGVANWTGARLGAMSSITEVSRALRLTIPSGGDVVVEVTTPAGEAMAGATCTASPCTVAATAALGEHRRRLTYRDSGGNVLRRSAWQSWR